MRNKPREVLKGWKVLFGLTMYERMMQRKGSKIIFFVTADIFSSFI